MICEKSCRDRLNCYHQYDHNAIVRGANRDAADLGNAVSEALSTLSIACEIVVREELHRVWSSK